MARNKKSSRLRVASSDSDDEDRASARPHVVVDPKVALQMADLGNAVRDRMTAHDREHDRNINFAQMNNNRKCNTEGTVEARNAFAHQTSLSGWNTFGGTDSTTNLDDIAQGQYHRLETTRKVQAESRELRLNEQDVNAESVDTSRDSRGYSSRLRDAVAARRNHSNTKYPYPPQTGASRPLDPAVDPDRAYRYKSGPAYGASPRKFVHGEEQRSGDARGYQGGGNAGAGGRRSAVSTPKKTGKGGVSRTARRVQERPWPPAALMGNPEPSLSPFAGNESVVSPLPVHSQPSFHADFTSSTAPAGRQVSQPMRAAGPLAETFGPWFSDTVRKQPSIQPAASSNIVHAEMIATDSSDEHKQAAQQGVSRKDSIQAGVPPPIAVSANTKEANPRNTYGFFSMGSISPQPFQQSLLLTEAEIPREDFGSETPATAASNIQQTLLDTVVVTQPSPPAPAQIEPKKVDRRELPQSSALKAKSTNVAVGRDVSKSRFAPPPTACQPAATAAHSPHETGTSDIVQLGASTLGDDSNLRRRGADGGSLPAGLSQSRFAPQQPAAFGQRGRPRAQEPSVSPGYVALLQQLHGLDLTVNTNRRPDEPALVKSTSQNAFTGYREPAEESPSSDDDDEL